MSKRMQSKIPLLLWVIILAAWTAHVPCLAETPGEDGSNKELTAKLHEFRSMCENSRFIEALQKGCAAANNENIFSNDNYGAQESLLFEVAVFHLEYTDRINNSAQARRCAEKAAVLWKRYIDWFSRLSEKKRSSMHGSHIRINMAVAHLGNALIRQGDLFQLFDRYANIAADSLQYFGTDAMAVWKDGLYGCPDGNAAKAHTAASRRNSIENGCAEHWHGYAAILRDWLQVAPLQKSAKTAYLREIEQIEREIERLGGES